MSEGENVVRGWLHAKRLRVIVLEIKAVAQVGQVCIKVAVSPEEDILKINPVTQLRSKPIRSDFLTWDPASIQRRVKIMDVVELEPPEVRIFFKACVCQVDSGPCSPRG